MAGRLGSGLWEEILQARHVHHRERRDVEGASRETWRADQVTDWWAELAGRPRRDYVVLADGGGHHFFRVFVHAR